MAAVRHLTGSQAVAALRRGAEIEQLLALDDHNDRRTLRWLSAVPTSGGFVLFLHVVDDDGSGFDLSEAPPLDEDELVGEGRRVAASADPERLLTMAAEHGAVPDRWVNQGVVGEEYRDARRRR